ncbi:MAG TPA: hypothetical protein VIY49_16355 [Bryobacteraceae bacterium]
MINHDSIDRELFRLELQAEVFDGAEGRNRFRIVGLEAKRGRDLEVVESGQPGFVVDRPVDEQVVDQGLNRAVRRDDFLTLRSTARGRAARAVAGTHL